MGEGLATMMVMAGATVVLGCRDSVKADAAVNRIKDATAGSPGSVETMELDLASFRSVRSFAEDYRASYKRLDVLVNNAGTLQACTTTEDGNEHAFQVNYLSHFLLTQLLLPTLKASAPSRVVHVTCEAAERSGQLPERGIWGRLYDAVLGSGEPVEPPLPIDVGDLDGQAVGARCSPSHQYAMSKLAVILFNAELDKRLYEEVGEDEDDDDAGSGPPRRSLVSHAVDPGDVATDFLSLGPKTQARQSMRTRMLMMFPPFKFMSWLAGGFLNRVYASMKRSVQRGAASQFHACTSVALGATGGNVYSDRAGSLSKCGREPAQCGLLGHEAVESSASDRHLRRALWRESERLVSREPPQPKESEEE